jgi:hypothetical protein
MKYKKLGKMKGGSDGQGILIIVCNSYVSY